MMRFPKFFFVSHLSPKSCKVFSLKDCNQFHLSSLLIVPQNLFEALKMTFSFLLDFISCFEITSELGKKV